MTVFFHLIDMLKQSATGRMESPHGCRRAMADGPGEAGYS